MPKGFVFGDEGFQSISVRLFAMGYISSSERTAWEGEERRGSLLLTKPSNAVSRRSVTGADDGRLRSGEATCTEGKTKWVI